VPVDATIDAAPPVDAPTPVDAGRSIDAPARARPRAAPSDAAIATLPSIDAAAIPAATPPADAKLPGIGFIPHP
jgi:hypothetical protein